MVGTNEFKASEMKLSIVVCGRKTDVTYIIRRINGIVAENPKKAMMAAKEPILCLMLEVMRCRIN